MADRHNRFWRNGFLYVGDRLFWLLLPEVRFAHREFQVRVARLSRGGRFQNLAENFSSGLLVAEKERLPYRDPRAQIQSRARIKGKYRLGALGKKLALLRPVHGSRSLDRNRDF